MSELISGADAFVADRISNLINLSPSIAPSIAPSIVLIQYAKELWELYENGGLHPDAELTGYFEEDLHTADVDSVLEEIKAAFMEQQARQERMRSSEEVE